MLENKVKSLIKQVKEEGCDYEYYPSTSEIIGIVHRDIDRTISGSYSILDIGAGNGNVFKVLKDLNPEKNITKYAIEKSAVLIENMEPDIFIVGTDFHQQTLIDKKVDVIFCNPPYSEFDTWAEKIITEANCRIIYMVIPERWKNNKKISEMLERRNMDYKIIGNTDFLDSEYRQARAKVDIIRFKSKNVSYNGRSYESEKEDPFNIWFDTFFKIKAVPEESEYDFKYKRAEKKKAEIKNSIIKGQNLIERLEELYRIDFDNLLNNYRALENLDPEIFKELGIDLKNLKGGLKLKIEGLKNLYWKELFDNLDTITARLTKASRKKLLDKLTDHTSVDFTSSNAYAVVIWAIKNANVYLDEQLKTVYNWMTFKDNVQNYKSNSKMISDGWRYEKEHTHYALDYRLVFRCHYNFNSGSYGDYDYPNGLHNDTHDRINDIITIARNLGFEVNENTKYFQWSSGKSVDFTCQKGEFMSVRAYKNGNIHVKANQQFMKKLNIEAGRLNGWVKSSEQAAEEMNIPIEEVRQMFKSNLQITAKSTGLLQIEERKVS